MEESPDRVVMREELCRLVQRDPETIRRWIKAKRLPKPDVAITPRSTGWRLSTLRAAGVGVA